MVWLMDLSDPEAKPVLIKGGRGAPTRQQEEQNIAAPRKAYRALVNVSKNTLPVNWYRLVACVVVVALDHFDKHLQRRRALDIATAFVKTAHGDHNEGPREKFLEVFRWFDKKLHEDSEQE